MEEPVNKNLMWFFRIEFILTFLDSSKLVSFVSFSGKKFHVSEHSPRCIVNKLPIVNTRM